MTRSDQERLAFALVPGEVRGWTDLAAHSEARLCFSVLERPGAVGAPILFLHGAASNASRYEAFFEQSVLPQGHRLLRMDLRCHGASSGLRPATLERHAADAAAVLDAAGVGRAVLVGHSLGAHVAMRIAADFPARVLGLALIDPLASAALTPLAERYKRRRPLLLAVEAIGRLADAMGMARRLPHYSLRREDELAQASLRQGGEARERFVQRYGSIWADLRHMHLADYARDFLEVGRPTPDDALKKWGAPMCVMASKNGIYTDSELLRAWAEQFQAAFKVLDCVHWPLTECPWAVEAALSAWIAGIDSSAAQSGR